MPDRDDATAGGADVPAGCAPFAPELAEFALGVSTGRDRARLVAHLEGCTRCQGEVDQLAAAADALLEIVPPADPPVGFEVRLFERLGASAPMTAIDRHRRRTREALGAAAAVVAIAAAGIGIGWAVASPGTVPVASAFGTVAGGRLEVVPLVSAGEYGRSKRAGSLYVYSGRPDWIFMDVDLAGWRGEVRCVARLSDGSTLHLGSFWLSRGSGAWGVSLPAGHHALQSAEIVTSGGEVLASARLRAD